MAAFLAFIAFAIAMRVVWGDRALVEGPLSWSLNSLTLSLAHSHNLILCLLCVSLSLIRGSRDQWKFEIWARPGGRSSGGGLASSPEIGARGELEERSRAGSSWALELWDLGGHSEEARVGELQDE